MKYTAAQVRFEHLAIEVLMDLLAIGPADLDVRLENNVEGLLVDTPDHIFLFGARASSDAASIAAGLLQLKKHAAHFRRKVVPLLVVPFMGEVGKRLCEEAGIGWFDLSGNARIGARGLRIHVDGRPNRFVKAGRPLNLFAPRSSRVARWFLMHPGEPITQRSLAHATEQSDGFVSKIVKRLEAGGYVGRIGESGKKDPLGEGFGRSIGAAHLDDPASGRPGRPALTARDPSLLLDAWWETYDFSKHRIIEGHVPARSGEDLAEQVSKILRKEGLQHAATGLAAAWAYTKFAQFRIASFYLGQEPTDGLLERLGFRADPKGANLWLVVPNDLGVFQGAADREGLTCVHPVQAYLDLKGHPERAKEAAERLRADFLNWEKAMMGKLQKGKTEHSRG